MRRSLAFAAIVFAALILSSCAKNGTETFPAPDAKHARVTMKDGTTTAGSVVSSSNKEITIAGDDKITRTIPMDQVRSVEYSDTKPAAAETATLPAAQPTTNSALPERETSVKPVQQLRQAANADNNTVEPAPKLQSTYELPVGTRVEVRTFETIDSATTAEGRIFPGEVTKSVVDGSRDIVIPARSNVEIVIKSASKGGHFRGTSDLVLDLKSVTIGGKRHSIETAAISKVGTEQARDTAG